MPPVLSGLVDELPGKQEEKAWKICSMCAVIVGIWVVLVKVVFPKIGNSRLRPGLDELQLAAKGQEKRMARFSNKTGYLS